MRTLVPSRALAGVAASLPLLGLLIVSVVQVMLMGEPDTSNARINAFALGLTVVATVSTALIAALGRWIPASASRALMAFAGGLGAAGACLVVTGGTAYLLACPLIGFIWGWVVATLHGAQRPSLQSIVELIPERDRLWAPPAVMTDRSPDSASIPQITVGHNSAPGTSEPLWQVQVYSRRMALLTVFGVLTFGAIVLLSMGVSSLWWLISIGLIGVAFCAVMLAWSRIEVQVDSAGIRVRSHVLGLPLVTVSADQILGVASAQIDPMVYGGWGLRWSARHTAFIVQGGPGLLVYRASGRHLALETPRGSDDADEGAAAVRAAVAELARRA
ncbi:MAG: hypothetical protein WBG57_00990 [Ornithinimicrobium sp.]